LLLNFLVAHTTYNIISDTSSELEQSSHIDHLGKKLLAIVDFPLQTTYPL
jgi:hypothetical protein